MFYNLIGSTRTWVFGWYIHHSSWFFLSPRDVDTDCRDAFMSKYKITKVKYFEETVFPDTPTTVVAFSFVKSDIPLTSQQVVWEQRPSGT